VKATLLKALEEDAEPMTTIPYDAVWIVDATAILQATKATTNMTLRAGICSVQRHH